MKKLSTYYKMYNKEHMTLENYVTSIRSKAGNGILTDYTFMNCPKLFDYMNYTKYTISEIVIELIEYRDKLKMHKGQRDGIIDFLNGQYNISVNDSYDHIVFKDVVEKLYEEYPNYRNNIDFNFIKEKLKSLEQFQAQILDKLTIFAELIDNFQKNDLPPYS